MRHRVIKQSRWSSPPESPTSPSAPSSPPDKKRHRESPIKVGKGYAVDEEFDENGNLLPPPELRIMKYSNQELESRRSKHGSQRCILDRQKFETEFNVATLNLSPEQRHFWDENPHVRQVFVNRRPLHQATAPLGKTDRIVSSATPISKYMRRFGEVKTVEHWGQRKLLFSEIEFFLMYADGSKEQQVVYAGAAPGKHTNFLSRLFPLLRFHLVDPAPFSCTPTSRIVIENAYFTKDSAIRWKDKVDLFISDIRAISWDMSDTEKENQVTVDMEWQQDWVQIIKPAAAMLKMRLPYKKGKTQYLDGHIHLPVWGGRTTSESRLVVTRADHFDSQTNEFRTRDYCHSWYEDLLFHFNTVTRTTLFPHDVAWEEGNGLDHCFDCASEIFLLEQYVHKYRNVTDPVEVKNQVLKLSQEITNECSSAGRTLKVVVRENDEE
eukprot:GGOE01043221.1.p1 GENE.GGOE01043221.1~~GGOE01043221.1.p1  ORF type:complete len:437 (+),score=55.82 GGOE01043221.1:74-1384(+)